jgi:cysteine synthase A
MARRLAREEGIFCGISSGCNVVACLKVARAYPALRQIVTMINDNGLRYLSTELWGDRDDQIAPAGPPRERPARPDDTRRLAGTRLVLID